MATLNINGADFYYREAGLGDPLLLIHGTGFSADVWDKTFDVFAQDHRTIVYDRRGYQRSQGTLPATANYGPQQADDIAALLKALKATPATLLGWSSGAIYSLHTALKYPDLVKRLILFEPPLYATKYLDLGGISMFARVSILKMVGNKPAAANAFLHFVSAYRDGRNSLDSFPPDFRAKLAQDTNTLLAEIDGPTGSDLAPTRLQTQITMPAVLVIGDQSGDVMKKMVKKLAGIIQAPILHLPNGNHLALWDQPAEFASVIKQALVS